MVSALHGAFDIFAIMGFGTLIECHDDIRAKKFLSFDGRFGGQAMSGAVDVAFESDSILVHFAGISE